jgi:hypothetical protein
VVLDDFAEVKDLCPMPSLREKKIIILVKPKGENETSKDQRKDGRKHLLRENEWCSKESR